MWELTYSRSKNRRKMWIYLKKNDEFRANVGSTPTSNNVFVGKNIFDLESAPYIEVTDDFEVLKQIEILSRVFLKASIIAFPNYTKKNYDNAREFGIYQFGKAKAELLPAQNAPYCLKLETSSWDGIADMKVLQEKLWAGTISPIICYGNRQVKQHPLNVLRQLLDSKSLTIPQRFFLALRLTKK